MRDDDIRRVLTNANPWWQASIRGIDPNAWVSSNRLMLDRTKYDLGYRSTILGDIVRAAPNGSLTVITGPRRIGKSVALLDAVNALCARDDIDPRQIIHVPCDGMRERDIRRAITLGRNMTKVVDVPENQPRIWMFDEISAIGGWTRALKAARDGTEFGDDTVVATGSRWSGDEDVQGNLMAGRAGNAPGRRIRQLLPMTFREFALATGVETGGIASIHPSDMQSRQARAQLENIEYIVDDLDLAWQNYLTCGGFPRAVFEFHTRGGVSTPYLRDLAAWLRTDVEPDAAADSVLKLLAGLSRRMTSPLNARSSSEALNYSSRIVFELRIKRLLNSHAALQCHRVDDHGNIWPRTQSKLYITDPLLSWMPSLLSPGLQEPDMTRLTEATIGVALARAIDQLDEGRWVSGDTIGYSRTRSGKEVDLAPVRVPTSSGGATTQPIEGKWVDDGWRGESKTIRGKYGRGIIATKSILDLDGDVWAIPAPAVSLLLA